MKSTRIVALAAAVPLAFSAAPAAYAQDADTALMCSGWAMLASQQVEDADQRRGLGMALAYFMGRYEAESDKQIGEVLTLDALPEVIGDLDKANATCQPLASGFGNRLTQVGLKMQAAAQAKAAAASEEQANEAAGR